MQRRSNSRCVIGGSNRRSQTPEELSSPAPPRPRTPLVLARSPSAASLRFKETMKAAPSEKMGLSGRPWVSEVSAAALTSEAQIRTYRRRPKSGQPSTSLERLGVKPPLKRPTTVGSVERRTLSGTELHGGKTLSGHQEYVMQAMTDFFGRRPLEQMRSAFRYADKDESGELDAGEFRSAMRSLNVGLSDRDIDTVFAIADSDGSGTLGIDEFFVNFRHDHWPRERFFWSTQAGGSGNLSKLQRFALSAKLENDFEKPKALSTPEVMKVLAEKVAVRGSAEKVFRIIDSNLNGTIDLEELPEAIRPYELHIDEEQAADVLAEINRIAGKPSDTPLNYNSFALAFNPTDTSDTVGSLAFQPVPPSELVRRRAPADNFDQEGALSRALGPERSLESLHDMRSTTSKALETVDHMRSISTLQPTPPLSHATSAATVHDFDQEADEQQRRFDQMAGWRSDGELAIDGGGGKMGKEIMKAGRDIDWRAHNKAPSKQMMYAGSSYGGSKSHEALTPLEMVQSVPSMSRVGSAAQLQSGADGALESGGADAAGEEEHRLADRPVAAARADAAAVTRPPAPHAVELSPSKCSNQLLYSQPTLSSLSHSVTNSTLSRSRLSLAIESAGSRSTHECLYPGITSHHHIHEADRLSHTSSIASLRSISSAHGNGCVHAQQREDRERRRERLYQTGHRQQERAAKLQAIISGRERRVVEMDDARVRIKAKYEKRIGEHQLLQLTRMCENGKAPIQLESAPKTNWVPAPPHLTSHWHTIAANLQDPPPRESAVSLRATGGRRSFTEVQLHRGDSRGGKVVWGGAGPDE